MDQQLFAWTGNSLLINPFRVESKGTFLTNNSLTLTLVIMSEQFSEGDQRFREFAAYIKS